MFTLIIAVTTILLVLLLVAAAALIFARGGRVSSAGARPQPPESERLAMPRGRRGLPAKDPPSSEPSLGSLTCTSGPLAGQQFDIGSEGLYIGRDGSLSQVVINDSRVSKRHVWVGPRGGRVAAVDQGSTNGTFLNVPRSQRITEVLLNPGDTVIVSDADVARFQYQK